MIEVASVAVRDGPDIMRLAFGGDGLGPQEARTLGNIEDFHMLSDGLRCAIETLPGVFQGKRLKSLHSSEL